MLFRDDLFIFFLLFWMLNSPLPHRHSPSHHDYYCSHSWNVRFAPPLRTGFVCFDEEEIKAHTQTHTCKSQGCCCVVRMNISFNHPVRIWTSTVTTVIWNHSLVNKIIFKLNSSIQNGRRPNDTNLSIDRSEKSCFQFFRRMEQCFDH